LHGVKDGEGGGSGILFPHTRSGRALSNIVGKHEGSSGWDVHISVGSNGVLIRYVTEEYDLPAVVGLIGSRV